MASFILKLVPNRLKKSIIYNYKEKLYAIRKSKSNLPQFDLEERHLSNLKVIVNRLEMIKLFPKGGVVAEIGVDKGEFTELILENNHPSKIHLIDSWDTDRYNHVKRDFVKNKFKRLIESKNLEINIGFSDIVLNKFPDNYFDWVYIDTNHTYQTTMKELLLAEKKVNKYGIISGHDYSMGNWIKGFKYGVIEAVHEFCYLNNWELIYLTMELSIPRSFALKKIVDGS